MSSRKPGHEDLRETTDPNGEAAKDDLGRERRKVRPISLLAAGSSQFAAQAVGLLLALLVSHLIARRLGAGPEADAFLLGRRLVTSVSEVVNQVMVVVLIPLIAARAAAGDSAGKIVAHSAVWAVALGVPLAAGFILGAQALVDLMAPRFDPATAGLAERIVMILAMSLPATVAAIAFSAYCNVRGHFGIPALIRQAPRAAVAMALLLGGGALAVQAASAYTTTFFGVAVLALVIALRAGSEGHGPVHERTASAAIERRSIAAILLALGSLASIWLETAFAARQGFGSITLLDLSQRLGALFGNTVATALALVTYTDLSRRSAIGETAEIGPRVAYAILAGLALLFPVQIGIFVNSAAIVEVIIAHGEMSTAAVARLTELVRWMACAPLGAIVTRMLLMGVLADRELPIVRLVGGAVILDVFARLALFTALTPWLGLAAIPISLTIAPIFTIIFLAFALGRRGPIASMTLMKPARHLLAVSALGSAAIVTGAALGPALANSLWPVVGDVPKLESLAQLAGSSIFGGLALGLGLRMFGVKLKPR